MKYVKYEITRVEAAEEKDEILWTFFREEDVIYVYPNSSSLSGVIVLANKRTAEKYKSMSENAKKGWRIDIFLAKSISGDDLPQTEGSELQTTGSLSIESNVSASFAPQRQSTPVKGTASSGIPRNAAAGSSVRVRNIPLQRSPSSRPSGSSGVRMSSNPIRHSFGPLSSPHSKEASQRIQSGKLPPVKFSSAEQNVSSHGWFYKRGGENRQQLKNSKAQGTKNSSEAKIGSAKGGDGKQQRTEKSLKKANGDAEENLWQLKEGEQSRIKKSSEKEDENVGQTLRQSKKKSSEVKSEKINESGQQGESGEIKQIEIPPTNNTESGDENSPRIENSESPPSGSSSETSSQISYEEMEIEENPVRVRFTFMDTKTPDILTIERHFRQFGDIISVYQHNLFDEGNVVFRRHQDAL
ncbi:unnamed protein product, partial [Hymenolepis diminuta]